MQEIFIHGTDQLLCYWNNERLPRDGDKLTWNNTQYEFTGGSHFHGTGVKLYVKETNK